MKLQEVQGQSKETSKPLGQLTKASESQVFSSITSIAGIDKARNRKKASKSIFGSGAEVLGCFSFCLFVCFLITGCFTRH